MIISKETWIQTIIWIAIWTLIPYLITSGWNHPIDHTITRWTFTIIGISIVVIINLEWLAPKFYFEKKLLLFILIGLAMVSLIVFLYFWKEAPWHKVLAKLPDVRDAPPARGRPNLAMKYLTTSLPYLIAFIGSTMSAVAKFANEKIQESAALKSENLLQELKILKAQINPHFLFNSLNNIYTLAITKSDKTAESILSLSQMLRYVLYDCNQEFVPIKSEVSYIEHFIELFALKREDPMDISFVYDEDLSGVVIAPMILIGFIENALKHSGIESHPNGFINARLTRSDESIEFCVNNSVPAIPPQKDEVGGIGLDNVRKRLTLLYPTRHKLEIESKEDRFSIILTLQT